ncbi:exopolygalacturonase isoform X2 [Capsella rubella]|uniref:exopolygalacturonase isoform X2 n=1 Tax=Capsella rubella TaxID=81985 RepID=UPI000CD4CD6C|nr:exopolygalacturonase isoform X2 [Capsella rubella]
MACIDFVFKVSGLTMLFIVGTTSLPTTVPKVFDVQRYGAKGDGKTDNTNAFTNTWEDACTWNGPSKMYIPNGRFYLGAVSFAGPCTAGSISFVIDGTLLAPPNNNDIKKETWINFRYIEYLTVSGSGTLDGQGQMSWSLNDCRKNEFCPKLAINMGFDFVKKSRLEGITSLNSKAGHFNFFSVDHFNITGVNIKAPGDSPNTDGIKIALSSNIRISNTNISTGDDCIAMLSGNNNFDIYNVTCGPGHGISIGSLGKNKDEKNVNGLTVRDTVFIGTTDGIRIKTWESSVSTILVSNFVYENLQMIDVGTPINIDQKYCPYPPCKNMGDSHIQIQNVTLKNIWGTSKNKVAVKFQCSKSFPCKDVKLIDINLKHNGVDGPAITLCENIKGSATGKMVPSHCMN